MLDWLSMEGCLTGAFVSRPWCGIQHHPAQREIDSFERKIRKKLAVVMTFLAWGPPENLTPFPASWCSRVTQRGSLPMITWEPWDQKSECRDYRLEKILNGQWDFYLVQWAQAVRQWKNPLLVRWCHEMNGTWYPWDGVHNSSDPSLYIKAFRYMVQLFKHQKAINAYWVWAPEVVLHLPHRGGIHDYTLYYPGDESVDWIGLDGYNFGTAPGRNDPWRSFDEIFGEAYHRMTQIAPKKPVVIAEFACGEKGGSKLLWIQETFRSMQNYPNLKAWIWFNIQKETDWPVDSSIGSLKAFQSAMNSPYFKERVPSG